MCSTPSIFTLTLMKTLTDADRKFICEQVTDREAVILVICV